MLAISALHMVDWAVIIAYFVVVAVVAWWASRGQDTSKDYFLAGRNIGWFVAGASLFATNIGSEHIVGLAGSGFKSGVAMAHYELHAWCLLVLGWLFVPFYTRSQVFTMPEFLERRYNSTARWILSVISLVAYVFTKVSVTVYAGGMVFQVLFPEATLTLFGGAINMDAFWVGALSTVVLTGLYTVTGGLRAVVWTDTMQAVTLIIGSVAVTICGLIELGGWGEMRRLVGSEHLNLWKPANDPHFPWPGMLFCAPIVGLWYWCTDQYIVQRTLATRNMTEARRSTIWGAYLKLLPVWLFIVPGLIAYALYLKGGLKMPMGMDPDTGKMVPVHDATFATMVQTLLPVGIRGLVVAGLLAALMSSLSSLFNSTSTLFTIDVYKKLHPQASEKTLVFIGRAATATVVVLGILWIPIMRLVSGGGLYKYLQDVQAYLAPPITAVFFLGVFWKRINAQGAIAGLIGGFALGMLKLAAAVVANWNALAGKVPQFIVVFGQFNFLYFALVLFGVSVGVIVGVSLLTPRPREEQIQGLTYATTASAHKTETRASWNKWDVIHTCVILAVITAVYVYFSG